MARRLEADRKADKEVRCAVLISAADSYSGPSPLIPGPRVHPLTTSRTAAHSAPPCPACLAILCLSHLPAKPRLHAQPHPASRTSPLLPAHRRCLMPLPHFPSSTRGRSSQSPTVGPSQGGLEFRRRRVAGGQLQARGVQIGLRRGGTRRLWVSLQVSRTAESCRFDLATAMPAWKTLLWRPATTVQCHTR